MNSATAPIESLGLSFLQTVNTIEVCDQNLSSCTSRASCSSVTLLNKALIIWAGVVVIADKIGGEGVADVLVLLALIEIVECDTIVIETSSIEVEADASSAGGTVDDNSVMCECECDNDCKRYDFYHDKYINRNGSLLISIIILVLNMKWNNKKCDW